MSVTLKQIADMAGVHKSTVDKVIHDRPGVSEAKREQIRALLKQYGYESNPLAKALNYQKKKLTVGILLAHTAASAALRRGIERVRQDCARPRPPTQSSRPPVCGNSAKAERPASSPARRMMRR